MSNFQKFLASIVLLIGAFLVRPSAVFAQGTAFCQCEAYENFSCQSWAISSSCESGYSANSTLCASSSLCQTGAGAECTVSCVSDSSTQPVPPGQSCANSAGSAPDPNKTCLNNSVCRAGADNQYKCLGPANSTPTGGQCSDSSECANFTEGATCFSGGCVDNTAAPVQVNCGSVIPNADPRICPSQCSSTSFFGQRCCGWVINGSCSATQPAPTSPPTTPTSQNPQPGFDSANSYFLGRVNPLTVTGNSNPLLRYVQGMNNLGNFSTPAGFINELLPYLFSLAGVILFMMLVWGGFEMMYGAADTKAQEAGKHRITAALIGFTLLFVSYWIAQILQFIFGVNILGG